MSCSNCPSGCAYCPSDHRKPPVYNVDKSGVCGCPIHVVQSTVPVYAPKCCDDLKVNTDPRRTEVYCPPVVSRSEPLSHAEYLRRLKAGGGAKLSAPSGLVQTSTGEYKKTLWMESNVGACCTDSSTVLPAVPAVHPIGHRLDQTGRAEVAGAIAGRGTLSQLDQGDRPDSLTTLRKAGVTLAADSGCAPCTATGTDKTTLTPNCCE